MEAQELLPRLKVRLEGECATDELLLELLEGCLEKACVYLWMKKVPKALAATILKWAVCDYNALGMEGETSRQEGGILRRVEAIPLDIQRELNAMRRGGAGLNAFKKAGPADSHP